MLVFNSTHQRTEELVWEGVSDESEVGASMKDVAKTCEEVR